MQDRKVSCCCGEIKSTNFKLKTGKEPGPIVIEIYPESPIHGKTPYLIGCGGTTDKYISGCLMAVVEQEWRRLNQLD